MSDRNQDQPTPESKVVAQQPDQTQADAGEGFPIEELDDTALEDVAGGDNTACPSANILAKCGGMNF